MINISKDSPEAVEFIILFNRLKDWSDDAPSELYASAERDVSLKDLCVRVQESAAAFKNHEHISREPFSSPVNAAFKSAWREYEACLSD